MFPPISSSISSLSGDAGASLIGGNTRLSLCGARRLSFMLGKVLCILNKYVVLADVIITSKKNRIAAHDDLRVIVVNGPQGLVRV